MNPRSENMMQQELRGKCMETRFMARCFTLSLPIVLVAIQLLAVPVLAQTETPKKQEEKRLANLTSAEYQKTFDNLESGWIPSEVTVQVIRNVARFNLKIVRNDKNLDWDARHHLTDAKYAEVKKDRELKGYREFQHRTYFINLERRHVVFWSRVDRELEFFDQLWADKKIPVSGTSVPDFKPVDELLLDFIRKQKLTGATVAISFQGKMLYSRGFGYADVEKGEAMEPGSLMRIASISKPFTAAAIMHLVDQRKLSLDDKVVNVLGVASRDVPKLGKGWDKIQIKHLLHHTAGFDRGKSGDPMFMPGRISRTLKVKLPIEPKHIIKFMMARPLDFEPGSKYVYSNFDYCLLGRVIEKISGKSYEQFVQSEVLRPVGVTQMKIGRSLEKLRAKNEVKYYTRKGNSFGATVGDKVGQVVPAQYGVHSIENMDAHGGWIASAPDLLKFATAFDRADRCPWMGSANLAKVFTQPEYLNIQPNGQGHRRFYGCGWSVIQYKNGKKQTMHMGALPGTSTLLVRRPDGFSWAVLFNCRKTLTKDAAVMLDPMLFRAINQAKKNAGIR